MPIRRRVYRQGNSWVISIPEWALDHCHLSSGDYFELSIVPGPAILLTPRISLASNPPGEGDSNQKGKEPK